MFSLSLSLSNICVTFQSHRGHFFLPRIKSVRQEQAVKSRTARMSAVSCDMVELRSAGKGRHRRVFYYRVCTAPTAARPTHNREIVFLF